MDENTPDAAWEQWYAAHGMRSSREIAEAHGFTLDAFYAARGAEITDYMPTPRERATWKFYRYLVETGRFADDGAPASAP